MQPATFNCTRCRAPLAPGSTQCSNCGLTFDTPVPYAAAPGYGAPPAKKSSPGPIIAIVCAVGCLPVIAIIAAILFPVFAKARDRAREVSSESNLRQVGLATLQFMQDHDEKMPPTDSMERYKAALAPYTPNQATDNLFVETGFNVPYALNPAVSKKPLEAFPHPESVVVMHETMPHSDGKIATLYMDGHVVLDTPGQ